MDKNFETLLKYQEYDIKLKRLLDTIERSDASKRMEQARTEFNIAKKTVQEDEKEAEKVVAYYEKSAPQLQELEKNLDSIIKSSEGNDNIAALIEQLEILKGKVIALEKKIIECKTSSEKILKSYQEANAIGHKMLSYFNSAKTIYNELIKASEPEISALKKKLKALEPLIEIETLKKYKEITKENKYPAFVEVRFIDGTYSCGACGLQLSQKNTSTLNENGVCTCETCRRVIFKRQ